MTKRKKHPEDMSVAELAKATKRFNQPFFFARSRPLTSAQESQERALRRSPKRTRPSGGKISVSLDVDLMERADALAKKTGVKRAELIAQFVAAGLKRRTA